MNVNGAANVYGNYRMDHVNQTRREDGEPKKEEKAPAVIDSAKEGMNTGVTLELSRDRDKKTENENETRSGTVTFNQEKRARQLASAKTAAQVRTVIGLLNKDLADCENGLSMGMCDENEFAKVKAMLQKAMQRLNEAANESGEEEEKGFDAFSINMLM